MDRIDPDFFNDINSGGHMVVDAWDVTTQARCGGALSSINMKSGAYWPHWGMMIGWMMSCRYGWPVSVPLSNTRSVFCASIFQPTLPIIPMLGGLTSMFPGPVQVWSSSTHSGEACFGWSDQTQWLFWHLWIYVSVSSCWCWHSDTGHLPCLWLVGNPMTPFMH